MQLTGQEELPLACDRSAIAANARAAHFARAARLMGSALQEQQELADGYAFRYHAAEYANLVAFIGNERLCCPFFHFTLDVAPAQGAIWLRITGGDGVKQYLATVLVGQPVQ